MTFTEWFASLSTSELHFRICNLSNRKLHLLTAALLRRVWDDLPSDHTRVAVEVTEQFADGSVSADELARLRSTDVLDSCEAIWLSPDSDFYDEQLIGGGCGGCWICDARAAEYECRVAKSGKGLHGVALAIKEPAWIVVQAALTAREIAIWKTEGANRDAAERDEIEAQYHLFREIAGPKLFLETGVERPDPRWLQWRTSDVRTLARSIYRDQNFCLLPILADALQDAGCDDEAVLSHCREGKNHVRGCWVVDLAMGIG